MRTWSFVFVNKEDCDKAFNQMFELFKNVEAFAEKKVIICRANENDGFWKVFLSIEDTVAGTYTVTTNITPDQKISNVLTTTKAESENVKVELPKDCKIISWYEAC